MIVLMALHGNHNHHLLQPINSEADVVAILNASGCPIGQLEEKCRYFDQSIPIFENLLGPVWKASGVTISRVNPATGQRAQLNTSDGLVTESDYWARFQISVEDFEQAILKENPDRYLAAIAAGTAAIEGFCNYQFLKKGNNAESGEIREPLDWKFENWIPRFTNRKLDKGRKSWERFKRLRQLRNDEFQHPKAMWSARNFSDLPSLFNDYRWGICRLLLELHVIFRERCPSRIIRYSFYPSIYWQKDDD
jgi:hypothetical protein